VLARALGGSGSKRSGGGGGDEGGGSGDPLKPSGADEQRALDDAAAKGGNKPIQVGEGTIVPGASGFAAGAARNDLPASLLVTLILLGAASVAAAVPYVRRRVFGRWLS
jgi:hypothetical protein